MLSGGGDGRYYICMRIDGEGGGEDRKLREGSQVARMVRSRVARVPILVDGSMQEMRERKIW